MLARTVSGGVTVNDCLLHFAQVNQPMGGVGASGTGAYHGQWGFDTFSQAEAGVLSLAASIGWPISIRPMAARSRGWQKMLRFLS